MPLIREVPLFNPKTHKPKFKSLTDKPEVDNPNEQQPDANVSSEPHEPSVNPEASVPTSQSFDGSEVELLPDEGENADPDIHVGWTCAASPPIWPCCNHHNEEIFAYAGDDQPAELGLDRNVFQYLVTPRIALDEAGPDYPVFQYHSNPNSVSPSVPVLEVYHVIRFGILVCKINGRSCTTSNSTLKQGPNLRFDMLPTLGEPTTPQNICSDKAT